MLYIPVILFQVAKVLSPKKSQLVGILLSSLRVDVSDIEHGKVLIFYMNTVMYFLKCLKLKKNEVKITEHFIHRSSYINVNIELNKHYFYLRLITFNKEIFLKVRHG